MFLYSIRKVTNAIISTLIVATLLYLFLNFIVFERIIMAQANNDQESQKYSSAIVLYNVAYSYYKVFHITDTDKEIYLEIPYKRAVCYLNTNQMNESAKSMLEGLTAIQSQYGVFSVENAYFSKKYLIAYYLDNDKYKLAINEFYNLLAIYKSIGMSNMDIGEMISLKGDLCYKLKDYNSADQLYQRAYMATAEEADVDYAILVKLANRIAEHDIKGGHDNDAIATYKKTLNILCGDPTKKHKAACAQMSMDLGNLYIKQNNIKEAIKCYESALATIKKMPKHSYLKQNILTYMAKLKGLYDEDNQYAKSADMDIQTARERRFSFLQIF